MLLFGLTGGVASGKSSVAARFRARGLDVIDADLLAREVVAPGSEGLAEVVSHFGEDVLDGDGSLNRRRLGRLVFAEPELRDRLNSLLHPRIRARTRQLSQELEQRGVTLACYEAALLVENGLADEYRPLVVVAVPPQLQLRRMMTRDDLTEEQARHRIASQLPLSDKVAMADHVIDNAGSPDQLQERADEILEQITRSWTPD